MIFAPMTDSLEIDLRKYIAVLFRHWWQILVSAAAIAVIVFVYSTITKPSYQATAMVAITKPRYQLSFNAQIQSINVQPANNAFLDLATSDDVLKQVLDQWTDRPASISGVEDLRDTIVKVISGSDNSILKLVVTTGDPNVSVKLANFWADTLVAKANSVYFNQDQQLSFLETQLEDAQKTLEQAEIDLADFQAQNQLAILSNQLSSTLQNHKELLTIQRNIGYLDESVKGLRAQLASNPGNQASITDQLSALILQFQAYNNQAIGVVNAIPLQLQFSDPAVFGSLSTQAQIAILDNLASSIQDRSATIDETLQSLAPKILDLQKTVQEYQGRQDLLQQTVDIAQQTYTTLAQTVNQTRISAQDPSTELQLASSALPPSSPLSKNRVRNTLIAGVAGGIIAIIVVLALDWWRGEPIRQEK